MKFGDFGEAFGYVECVEAADDGTCEGSVASASCIDGRESRDWACCCSAPLSSVGGFRDAAGAVMKATLGAVLELREALAGGGSVEYSGAWPYLLPGAVAKAGNVGFLDV